MATSLLAYWVGGGGAATLGGVKRVLSARSSVVPEGRTLVDVAWTVRDTAGALVVQFNGPPDLAASGPNVSGLNIEATVDGLPAQGEIELTITDSYGAVASAGLSY